MNATRIRFSVLTVTLLLCGAWSAAVWIVETQQWHQQTEATIDRETDNVKTRGETISADVRHSVQVGAAVPEVLAQTAEVIDALATRKLSNAPQAQRLAAIKLESRSARIMHLNHLLALAKNDFAADVVWVVDTNGDGLAASNFDSPLTFIGTNFSERHYFTGAMAGDNAYQFAVGKVSHEPGLYFSSPVMHNGRVIGAVVTKVATVHLAQHIDLANVFLVDENGVAVLSQDPRFEMKAVSGNRVAAMPYERRMSIYQRNLFELLDIRPWPGYPRLSAVGASSDPYLVSTTSIDDGRLVVYVLAPATHVLALRSEFMRLIVLIAVCGSAIVVIVAGLVLYGHSSYASSRLLKVKHDELNQAQKMAKMGSWSYDCQTREFSCSNELLTYFMMLGDEVRRVAPSPLHIYSHVHVDDRDRVEQAFSAAFDNQKGFNLEYRMLLKSGEVRNIIANAEVERSVSGQALKITGTLRDVTEEQRARRTVEASVNHLRRVLNSSLIGILQGNDTGRIVDMNQAFINLTGYQLSDLEEGRLKWKNLAPREFENLQSARIFGLVSNPVPFEMELIVADGSTLPVLIGMAQVQETRGEWVCFVLDLSERNRVNRMQSEFISVVSHELRTPLTSIRGSLALLESGLTQASPEQRHELIKIAHRNSQRLIDIVNDILDMQKLMAGKMTFTMQAVNLVDVISQAIEVNAGFAQQYQVRFVTHDMPADAWISGDAARLMQVLTNLMSNAAKFSPEGGVVDLYLTSTGTQWRVAIRDHGQGIPEEFHGRIFGAFSQAENANVRQKGGTGLGLNITRSMVEKMGGSIGFDSIPGQGATFWVCFPAVDHED